MFQNYFNVWQRVQVESALINRRFKIFKKNYIRKHFYKMVLFQRNIYRGKKEERIDVLWHVIVHVHCSVKYTFIHFLPSGSGRLLGFIGERCQQTW